MNIGAYIIICAVGAVLMIIGFWIGYIYRATHEPPSTPVDWGKVINRTGIDLGSPEGSRTHGFEFTIDKDGKFEETDRQKKRDFKAGKVLLPTLEKKNKDAPKV